MDQLWSPWRYQYVSTPASTSGCIFCVKGSEDRDKENYIVHRGEHSFVILNLYPYSTGHLMVAPYAHVPDLESASEAALNEIMKLARLAQIHLHVLPRWAGDTNFMTTVAETRVLPESLDLTFEKLKKAFGQ